MDELNPNHPVTQSAHDQWHKFVAILMAKFGKTEVNITEQDIARLGENQVVAVHYHRETISLKLVSREEGERLAREAGGLPA